MENKLTELVELGVPIEPIAEGAENDFGAAQKK